MSASLKLVTVALLMACADCIAADTVIDIFEGANAPAPWTFSNGAEFPGATGSLTAGAGHSGRGAHLAYNLSKGGHYVSAKLTLPVPLTLAGISFWVKSPTNITIVLRVVDASGQTLQYGLYRPLENLDPAAWYQQTVPLDSAGGWWGGANDGQLHSPISSVAVLAADPLYPGPSGAIDLDDVTGLASTTFALDPAAQPLVPAPVGSGDVLSRLGVNIHFTSNTQALDAAQSAGFTWVRMDLKWRTVETTPNVYDWSAYDILLDLLDARGMKALLILDYGNVLYTGTASLPPTNSAAIQAFGNYAYAAARHFAGRGVAYEIWNEPNGAGFWPPAAKPAQYAALAKPTTVRVHQGDASAPVVTGGLVYVNQSYGFLTKCLPLGAAIGASAIGVHPYDCNPPELLSDRLMFMRAIVAQYVTNAPPVWDTEWAFSSALFGDGHSASARQRQAVMVARELLTANAAGFPLIIYYDILDDGTISTNRGNNCGLLASDYSDKPAMQAVRTLSSVARTRRFSGFIHTAPSNLTALRFDGRTNLVVALWSSTPAGQVTVTVPTNTTATDFLGAPLTLVNWTNRLAWTVYESNGPVYFSFPGTPEATNLGPVLAPLSNRTVIAGAALTLTNSATYQDAPPQTLTYSLCSPPTPPAGASIDPNTGLFTWRPALAQSNTTNRLGIVVADHGVPSLCATQFFTVTVLRPAQPALTGLGFSNGTFHSLVVGDQGPDYSILGSTDLYHWTPILTSNSPATPFLFADPAPAGRPQFFYRVQLGP